MNPVVQTLIYALMLTSIVEIADSKAKRSARKDGDFIIGALFPVHRDPKDVTGYTRTCGKVWEQYGIHRIEIFLRTLEQINDDESILPNITLGYDIRDSCWYSPIALEQSIDFVKDYISSMKTSNGSKGKNTSDACLAENRKPIVGLIGPGSSQNTIQVQNLLQIFKVPQIGYSATSMELSDKNLYQYFLRVVPSDRFQAQALADIVQRFNWTYISTVHTDGNYGTRGIQEFEKLANRLGICIANSEGIKRTADEEAHKSLITKLMKTRRARVVICFCEGQTVTNLYNATRLVKGANGHFLFIGSDGWADRPDVVEGIEKLAVGGMSIKLHSPEINDFDDYFRSLNPFTNSHNPWFREFWEEKFNCSLTPTTQAGKPTKNCTGKEQHAHFVQDSKLGFVINAITVMAQALHNMHKDVCGGHPGICQQMSPPEGEQYLKYLLNVSLITYSNEEIHFDEAGDPPARYDIMNYQVDQEGKYMYTVIGAWKTGNLSMNDSAIYWPSRGQGSKLRSVCSEPCQKGFYKFIEGNVKCCWKCLKCEDNEILLDESTCKPCSKGWWPNEQLTACRMIQVEYLGWFDKEAMVAMVMACVGIFVTLWIGIIFIRHNDTPVVKASTRELSYIIMLGITMAFTSNFVLVAKPTIVTCYFTRILPGLSFSLIYGALVTKTNRIARILEGTKKIVTKKPRFMSASAQVIITCILVGIECAIITVMLIVEPADSKLDYPTSMRVRLICNTSTLGMVVPLGFDLILIFMCTLYAIKTRNLPENFNEAKFIGFTMYTTCVIWLGFFAIYFSSEPMVLTMSVAISLSASVALVLLFFPKVYVIVWAPEKNTRSAFTTSKDVRCHIGSVSFHSENSFDVGRDKKLYDQHGSLVHRKRSVLGRLKVGAKDKVKVQSRRDSATVPPNMRLNRQNSTHVATPSTSGQKKFPWAKDDAAKSDDDPDRLSTISSKEESRNGSERRKGDRSLHKQDSQCQTDEDLFNQYMKKKAFRRRKRSSGSKKSSSIERVSDCSESSINSDEIFLSLPFADSNEGRGVYRLSPRCSDKSPLLRPSDTSEGHLTDESKEFRNRCSPSYNFMSDFQKFEGSRDKDIPNEPSPVPQNVRNYDSSCSSNKTNTDYENTAFLGNDSLKLLKSEEIKANGPLIKLQNFDDQIITPPRSLVDGSSGRYSRNIPAESGKSTEAPRSYATNTPDIPVIVHDSFLPTISSTEMNKEPRSSKIYSLQDCRKDDGNCLFTPENHSNTRNITPEYHSNTRHSITPSVTSQRSSLTSIEDMPSMGLRKLDEEEVSMMSFHDYLKNRGVELDLSAVQSSEV